MPRIRTGTLKLIIISTDKCKLITRYNFEISEFEKLQFLLLRKKNFTDDGIFGETKTNKKNFDKSCRGQFYGKIMFGWLLRAIQIICDTFLSFFLALPPCDIFYFFDH